MPMVPIVPLLPRDMHRMYRSYGGFTFAMKDFINIGLIDIIDTDKVREGMKKVDPFYSPEQLKKVPVMAVVSAGDEFMQMDWTQIWNDEMGMFDNYGEMHLYIVPNDEHGLIMNVGAVLSNGISFARSIAKGETAEQRPSFRHEYNDTNGEIIVRIADGFKPMGVYLRYTQTYST